MNATLFTTFCRIDFKTKLKVPMTNIYRVCVVDLT